MNKYLRQLFTAVVALFVILGLSSTIIMAVRANALNNDPRNARSLYHQLGAYRGAILASDGTVMAKSEPVNDAFKYLRTYSNGPLYAPVTGFFSINQTADRGLEASRSMLLNGEADSLIWQRAKAMLTGATDQGASIETSIDPKLQQVAYDQLGTRDGAAVAIEVSTGRILAMVSTPSYDPNKLATHDTKAASQAYNELSAGQNSPLIHLAAVPTRVHVQDHRRLGCAGNRRLSDGHEDSCGLQLYLAGNRHTVAERRGTGRWRKRADLPARGRRMVVQYRVRPAWRETRREQGFGHGHQAWFRQHHHH